MAFTSYTFVISIWGHILIVATRRPAIWVSYLRIIIIFVNIALYASTIAEVVLDDESFIQWKAMIIVGFLVLSIGFGYLIIGRKIAKIALATEAIAGQLQRKKIIKKVTKRTYIISLLAVAFVAVFALVGGLSYVTDNIPFFLVRHYLYRGFEWILIAFMVVILHKKRNPTERTNSSTKLDANVR